MLTVTALTNAEYLLGSVALGVDEYDVNTARRALTDAERSETEAQQHLADLTRHQRTRAAALADTASERQALSHDITHLDTALHLTRVERVLHLANDPTRLHLEILGPVPTGPAGRAVRRHQASRLEQHLDHTTHDDNAWRRLTDDLHHTPALAHIADRHIRIPGHELRPTDWAPITQHASAYTASVEQARPRPHATPEIELDVVVAVADGADRGCAPISSRRSP